jgi:hypothetical protein
MSKTARLKLSKLLKSRLVRKTNKLLLKYNFYILKVFEQISRNQAIAQWGDTHSETLIERVKISLPIAIASRKNLGKFKIEAGGH